MVDTMGSCCKDSLAIRVLLVQVVLFGLLMHLIVVIFDPMWVVEHVKFVTQLEKALLDLIKTVRRNLVPVLFLQGCLLQDLQLTSQIVTDTALPHPYNSIIKCNEKVSIWSEFRHGNRRDSVICGIGNPIDSVGTEARCSHACPDVVTPMLAHENRAITCSNGNVLTTRTVCSTSNLLTNL